MQEDDAASKRAGAEEFGKNASAAAGKVSAAVARFTGVHEDGCDGLRKKLNAAEGAARCAARELSAAAVAALKEVRAHVPGVCTHFLLLKTS